MNDTPKDQYNRQLLREQIANDKLKIMEGFIKALPRGARRRILMAERKAAKRAEERNRINGR